MANLQHSIDVALLEKQLTDVKSGATTAANTGVLTDTAGVTSTNNVPGTLDATAPGRYASRA